MEDNFSTDGGGGSDGSGGNVSDGERWGVLVTSCCGAQFLTGRGPVLVHGPGVGKPCFKAL